MRLRSDSQLSEPQDGWSLLYPPEFSQAAKGVLVTLNEEWLDEWMRHRIDAFGISARALSGSPSAVENERARFDALYQSLPQPLSHIRSLLDVGCGFGRLREDLRRRDWTGRYVGIEASGSVFRRIPPPAPIEDSTFVYGQVHDLPQEQFDVVVALGIFNHLDAFVDSERGLRETIAEMWQRTQIVCVVDFLSPNVDYVSDIAIHRPFSEVLREVSRHTQLFSLNHAYLPYEYMLSLYR